MVAGNKYALARPYVHIALCIVYILAFNVPNILKYDWPWNMYFPAHTAVLLGTFYFNYGYLINKFFKQEKYNSYWVGLLLTYLVGVFLIAGIIKFLSQSSLPPQLTKPRVYIGSIITYSVEFSLLSLAKVAKDWYGKYKVTKKSQIEHMQAELRLLRTQLDPHFIFNTLNNIYLLVLSASPKASDSILMLSELLNYILYESNEEKVTIDKELEFIESYINLQKLRLDPSLQIIFEIEGERKGMIPPLILFNFVENAFKHAIQPGDGETFYVSIIVKMRENHLYLVVKNYKKIRSVANRIHGKGIGLENTVKRLSLIYDNSYSLDIDEEDKIYSVQLRIPVHENTMLNNR